MRDLSRYRPPHDHPAPTAALFVLAAILVVAGVAGGIAAVGSSAPPVLTGALVPGQPPAPDFTLKDTRGGTVSLSQLRGQVVVLTFVWTHCPDACRSTVQHLVDADFRLSSPEGTVTWLGVTVDPSGDGAAPDLRGSVFAAFTLPNWHYLIGSQQQLQSIWSHYYVGTEAARGLAEVGALSHPPTWLSPSATETYLIDPQGRERVVLGSDVTAAALIRDIRIIARPG